MSVKRKPKSEALTGKTIGIAAPGLTEQMLAPATDLVPMAKAYFIGEDGANESRALVEQDKSMKLMLSKGALEPPYPPNMLALIFENSSNLRQNVDSYTTNIDSFGHAYVPVIDIDDVSANERIRDAIRAERLAGKRSGAIAKDLDALAKANDEPTNAEVKARKDQLKIDIRIERERLDAFFDNCTPTMPFSGPEGLRGLTRQDIEVFGYGYWEVLRDKLGDVSQFNRIDGRSVRLMPEDDKPTDATMTRKISLLQTAKAPVKKRFRRYVQAYEPGVQVVFFKEFGDPRCVDSRTGRYYKDVADMTAQIRTEDPNAPVLPATELFPFKITSTRSPYGVPRWIGALLCVLGTRQSEEVNFLYFENRSVPPMAILVSGGHLNKDTVGRLEDYIANQIRGKRNFHKVMILEAEGAANADPSLNGKMKITLQPLTDAQQKDALFQGYDERNADKVGQTFRLPRILRGDVRDFNRSTAEAALDFAELQVFGPIRQDFDWRMNKLILPELGIKYHTFRSNAPTIRDPETLSKILVDMVTANILVPAEARELTELVFNRSLQKIDEDWTNNPIGLTLVKAGQQPKDDGDDAFGGGSGGTSSGGSGGTSSGGATSASSVPGAAAAQRAMGQGASKPGAKTKKAAVIASGLTKIHAELMKAEREEFDENQKSAEVIKVPADIFHSFFAKADKAS